MVVAESRGLLRPLPSGDDLGRIRETLILHQLQRETMAKAAEMQFNRESAAAQYVPGTENEAFKFHRETSHKKYLLWLSHTQPFMDWEKKLADLEHEEWTKDVKQWEDEWGSLSDPEVQAETDRLAEWLRHGDGDPQEI